METFFFFCFFLSQCEFIEEGPFLMQFLNQSEGDNMNVIAQRETKEALTAAVWLGSLMDANIISKVEETKWNRRETSWSHVWCRHLSASLPAAITTRARADQCSCLQAIISITRYRFYKGIKRLPWQNRSHFTSPCCKWIVFFPLPFILSVFLLIIVIRMKSWVTKSREGLNIH